MAELAEGMAVKVNPKIKKHASVGNIDEIKDGIAKVRYSIRYGRGSTYEEHPVANLIHVCNRIMSSGFNTSKCGKPAKEGNLCGIHAAADRRIKNNVEKERAAQEAANAYRTETRLIEAALDEQIDSRGLRELAPSLKVLHARNGTVSLELSDLLDLIRNA